jgi:hypothetical protein
VVPDPCNVQEAKRLRLICVGKEAGWDTLIWVLLIQIHIRIFLVFYDHEIKVFKLEKGRSMPFFTFSTCIDTRAPTFNLPEAALIDRDTDCSAVLNSLTPRLFKPSQSFSVGRISALFATNDYAGRTPTCIPCLITGLGLKLNSVPLHVGWR